MNPVLKVVIGVLAVIGAISLLSVTGMGFMHYSMMDGFGC